MGERGGDQIDADGVMAATGAGHHDDLPLDEFVATFLPRDPGEELFGRDRRVVWSDVHSFRGSITGPSYAPGRRGGSSDSAKS